MPYRKQQFVNGEFYHVVARRIEDNLLFKDINDYYRGIFSIYEFNNSRPVTIRERRALRARLKARRDPTPVSPASPAAPAIDNREMFVEILSFCFMPNHIHLLLKQVKDNGVSNFMQKFGAGYAAYFKKKYNLDRKGHFFQGRFTSVPVKTDEQLKNVFVYIHTNPLAIVEPKWKELGVRDAKGAAEFIRNYKWSSYPDYIGIKNFPSVSERNIVSKIIGGDVGCQEFVESWIKYKGMIKDFAELSLE